MFNGNVLKTQTFLENFKSHSSLYDFKTDPFELCFYADCKKTVNKFNNIKHMPIRCIRLLKSEVVQC